MSKQGFDTSTIHYHGSAEPFDPDQAAAAGQSVIADLGGQAILLPEVLTAPLPCQGMAPGSASAFQQMVRNTLDAVERIEAPAEDAKNGPRLGR